MAGGREGKVKIITRNNFSWQYFDLTPALSEGEGVAKIELKYCYTLRTLRLEITGLSPITTQR
jgi:hypothetical protein